MFKIALCDDDKSYLELLSFKIQKILRESFDSESEIRCFYSAPELHEHIQVEKPDIIFFDIMINEVNMVNLLIEHHNELRGIPFIIMTGFPTETENLSEVDCCYYLLKSKMTDEQLFRALKRAIDAVTKNNSQLEALTYGNTSYMINFNSVLYIESFKNNLLIHCVDGSIINVYSSLKKITGQLPPYFYQCHKSFIVNMNLINGYEPHNFIFSDDVKIPIPPKKYKSAITHYQSYINSP